MGRCRSFPMRRNFRKHVARFKTTFFSLITMLVSKIWIASWLLEGQKQSKQERVFLSVVDYAVLRALSLWLVILFMINVCIASQHIIYSVCSSHAPISKAPARPACNNKILLVFKRNAPACCAHVSFCGVDSGTFDGTAACPNFLY